MENQERNKISNDISSIARAEKYLGIASNIAAMAMEESFEGAVDDRILHAYHQAIVDAANVLLSIRE